MFIRSAKPADAPEITRLLAALGYQTAVAEVTQRLAALLPSPRQRVLVAETEEPDRLQGVIAAERRLMLELGERIEIVALVVDSGTRRAGVGRGLVAAVECWAQEQRLPRVIVRSNVARTESHPFYERIGYRRQKTQHVYEKQLSA